MPKRQAIQPAECLECGNARSLLGNCTHCGSDAVPHATRDWVVLNLELGAPTAEDALDRLTRHVRGASEVGIRTMIVIHGYGSSGSGGKIKWVVRDALENNYFSDRVDEYYFGEDVAFASSGYHDLLRRRPGLKEHLAPFKVGNAGMTVLLMR
ncbi:MAG: DNA mismatch repair protein MutS [Polynucleobacter sp.]|nr:DNA mismatch repair protein MutS [Polynucleobacter sp.]MDZ4055939.1 DNA mismatch repair protein MutS [Polynucleobacter sp.]